MRVFGADVELVNDVGVAGLHRVLGVRDRLAAVDCLIVVAGMDGALSSVVGGLEFDVLQASPNRIERLLIRSGATTAVQLRPAGT